MVDDAQQADVLDAQERDHASQWLVQFMQGTLQDCRGQVDKLQRKLSWTYWVIVGLSILMFLVGMGLIIAAAVKGFRSREFNGQTLAVWDWRIWPGFTFFAPLNKSVRSWQI